MVERFKLVVILGALSAFGPLSLDFYLPALPQLTNEFGASAAAGQLTLTACVVGLAFGQLVAGPLSDRFGRRPPLLAGLAAYFAASIACAVAPSVWMLVALRFVQGIGGAAGIVLARSIVRDLHSGAAVARMFSILMLVAGVVPVVAPVVGGQLLHLTSWRGLFVILAGIDAAILVAVALSLRETLPSEHRRRGGASGAVFIELLRDRLFLSYAVVLGFSFAGLFSYIAASSFVLEGVYGLSPQLYGAVFGLNGLGIIACAQLNRVLLGRYPPERILGAGVATGATAGVTLLALALAGDARLAGILACLFVSVSTIGLVIPNAAALALTDYPHAAGSASAVLGTFQFTFGAAAAPIAGVAGKDTVVPMALLIALFGAGALVAVVVARRAARCPLPSPTVVPSGRQR